MRPNNPEPTDPLLDANPGESIEESWTFIGDDSTPEFKQNLENAGMREGGRPRVSLDQASRGLKVVSAVEPVNKRQSWRKSQ